MSDANRWGAGSIVTSEAVVLDFHLAGVGSRAIARTIDTVVQYLAFLAIALLGLVGSVGGNAAGIVVFLVGAFLVVFGYPVAMEMLANGRTLGKMAAGIRVVTVEGAPVRFRHASLRALLAIFDVLLCVGGIAVVSALLTRRGQRLGDLAAGTMVIRDRTAAAEATAQRFPPPIGLEAFTASIDARSLKPGTYLAVRNFLTRAYDIHEPARSTMAADLAGLVQLEVRSPPPPPATSPSMYLAAVAAATQAGERRSNPPPPPNPASRVGAPVTQPPPPVPYSAPLAPPAQHHQPPAPAYQPAQAATPPLQPPAPPYQPAPTPPLQPSTPQRSNGGFAPPG